MILSAALFITSVLIWGFTWYAITFQLGEAPVEVALAYRFGLASATLFLVLGVSGWLRRIKCRQQPYLALTGLCMFCVNYILIYPATGLIASGLVALLFSTSTICNAVNCAIFYHERPGRRTIAGALLGIGGLACLVAPDLAGLELGSSMLAGVGLVLIGVYSFSLGNMISLRNSRVGLHLPSSVAWSMAWGTAFLTIDALARGAPFPVDLSGAFLIALLYLAIPGSAIGFLTYLALVDRLGPARAAFTTVLYPVIALTVSTVFEDYRWTLTAVLGVLLIALGNALVFAPRAWIQRAATVTRPGRAATPRRTDNADL